MTYDWLTNVCLRAVSPTGKALRAPFTFTRGDKQFTCATNGHVIVEIAGYNAFPSLPEMYQEAVEKVLIPTPEDSSPIDYGMMRAFILGAMDGAVRSCEACDSKGEVPSAPSIRETLHVKWMTCQSCLGSSAEPVRVYIDSLLVNARLLELPFSNLPDTGQLLWQNSDKEKIAFLDAGSWRVGLMPLRDSLGEGRRTTVPHFHIEKKERAA